LDGRALHYLFYVPPDSVKEGRLCFPPEESSHMVASLRFGAGDPLQATDGAGRLYDAVLEEASRNQSVAAVTAVREIPRPPVSLILFQGLIKFARMDTIVEKCTELGVDRIQPVLSERAVPREAGRRLARWRKIALEAMKQSRRVYLPEVGEMEEFRTVLPMLRSFDAVLAAHEGRGRRRLRREDLPPSGRVAVLVGPEGGFTEGEMADLDRLGAVAFGLGPRRLRSDTAAISSIAVISALLPD
jgi:16S rRNA (uracil1498-N3)-methyltransferase